MKAELSKIEDALISFRMSWSLTDMQKKQVTSLIDAVSQLIVEDRRNYDKIEKLAVEYNYDAMRTGGEYEAGQCDGAIACLLALWPDIDEKYIRNFIATSYEIMKLQRKDF